MASGDTCTAIHIRTHVPCTEPKIAHRTPGAIPLFCSAHAQECHNLYKRYKQHQANLEVLERNPPRGLPGNLGNNKFEDVEDMKLLDRTWEYCRLRYNLLDRCITAREIHHMHFYKDTSGECGICGGSDTFRELMS